MAKKPTDESRKVPRGKTRIYEAAAALGRRRMASMGPRELRKFQRRAAWKRWHPDEPPPDGA